MCTGIGRLLRVFASPQGGKTTVHSASSTSSAYCFLSTESESSNTTGGIPQKRNPRSTNRCANSWRNPTARASEGLAGGEAHQAFEMVTSCEGQCIIDGESLVINEKEIHSKESGLMVVASHCRSAWPRDYELGESNAHSNSYHSAIFLHHRKSPQTHPHPVTAHSLCFPNHSLAWLP